MIDIDAIFTKHRARLLKICDSTDVNLACYAMLSALEDAAQQCVDNRHHRQIVRLHEWLQANAADLYHSFDGDAVDLMIAFAERQRHELDQLQNIFDETLDQLALVDADNAALTRKLKALQEAHEHQEANSRPT